MIESIAIRWMSVEFTSRFDYLTFFAQLAISVVKLNHAIISNDVLSNRHSIPAGSRRNGRTVLGSLREAD
jgi:hypothetical protein